MSSERVKTTSTSSRVLKALGIFGGVQVIVVLCSIIRNKCVAVWLGTAGIGVFALYNYTLDLINQLCQLNIRQSGVRDISAAPQSARGRMIAVVRRVSCSLGIIGAIATACLSPLLSRWTFGDYNHTWGFVLLSLAVGLNAMMSGEQAVLQASERLKLLARTSVIGATAGTAVSVFMFRFMGMNSIIPSILTFVVISAVCSIYFSRRSVKSPAVTTSASFSQAGPMLRLGLYMTIALVISSLSSYVFISWLRAEAGEQGVGLYQSGYMIVNQYVGLIFMALGVEYFPRMSRVAHSGMRTSIFMRHELRLLLLLLLPAVTVFISATPLIVRIIYSREFFSIVPYLSIAAIGTIFKAISFVMAFVILARGDGKAYLVTESISAVLYILLSVAGYRLGGLEGIACGYVVWYILYTLSTWIVCHYFYHLKAVGSLFWLGLVVIIIAGMQSALCLWGHYIPAVMLSVAVVSVSAVVYYLAWKRRTVKE